MQARDPPTGPAMRFDGGAAALPVVAGSGARAEPLFSDDARRRRPLGLTPLIDVVFLLVIFFMLARLAFQLGDPGFL